MAFQSCTSDLVASARDDPEAFAIIYRSYVKNIYRYIFHQVNNSHDAEDLTAQVFAAAWESLPNYRERGLFTAWIFSIARNQVGEFRRKHQINLSLDLTHERLRNNPDLIAQIETEERLAHLKGLITSLSNDQKELLSLRFGGGLTYREIGAMVGKSESAI